MRMRPAILLVLASSVALVGCEDWFRVYLQDQLQSEIQALWAPARKADIEQKAETQLARVLDEHLEDATFDVTISWRYWIPFWGWQTASVSVPVVCFNVDGEDVRLGDRAPTATLPTLEYSSTANYHYLRLTWTLDWAAGNGARVDFNAEFDYDTPGWVPDWAVPEWLAPDHSVTIDNFRGSARGRAYVYAPKVAGVDAYVYVYVDEANLNADAEAEGWFWSVDVSGPVDSALDTILTKKIVGKAISARIDPANANLFE